MRHYVIMPFAGGSQINVIAASHVLKGLNALYLHNESGDVIAVFAEFKWFVIKS